MLIPLLFSISIGTTALAEEKEAQTPAQEVASPAAAAEVSEAHDLTVNGIDDCESAFSRFKEYLLGINQAAKIDVKVACKADAENKVVIYNFEFEKACSASYYKVFSIPVKYPDELDNEYFKAFTDSMKTMGIQIYARTGRDRKVRDFNGGFNRLIFGVPSCVYRKD